MFLSRNKQQPRKYRQALLVLRYTGGTNALMQSHQRVRSVNGACCESVTKPKLSRHNCESNVTPTAVIVHA